MREVSGKDGVPGSWLTFQLETKQAQKNKIGDLRSNRASRVAQLVKESSCKEGDQGLIPRSGRSPGEGTGYPIQYSCLESPMDKGAWRATVYRVTRVGHQEAIDF